jgi:hypothetical protein
MGVCGISNFRCAAIASNVMSSRLRRQPREGPYDELQLRCWWEQMLRTAEMHFARRCRPPRIVGSSESCALVRDDIDGRFFFFTIVAVRLFFLLEVKRFSLLPHYSSSAKILHAISEAIA